jgi:uncharacterized protein YjiS (DUF1127 family)
MSSFAAQQEAYLRFQVRNRRDAETTKGNHMLIAAINFIHAWKRYNASMRELYLLDDRELADIGITRSDIPRIAWDDATR